MHELFKEDLLHIGAPLDAEPATNSQIEYLKQHLPSSFAEYIELYGFGNYFNRRIQYCDPANFRAMLALIFAGDADFSHKDCHVVAYTAFGELWAWSERHELVEINLIDLKVKCTTLFPSNLGSMPLPTPKNPELARDINVKARVLLPSDPEYIDEGDFMGNDMFDRCVKMHGALTQGECYGFFPAIAMLPPNTRERKVENIKRVSALEHFTFLAQLGQFNLVQFDRGRDVVMRAIG